MRTRRWLGSAIVLAGMVTLNPATASADGGAYIDLDRTHFLVGSTGHAETYVSVPVGKQDLFEQGPFYLYITPNRSPVTEGEPLPSAAVRVAAMTIEPDRGTAFELSASFTVPDLPGRYYALGVCNDPCTISGFREPLTGTISIVQTAREADLLNEQQRLTGEIYGFKRQIKKQRNAHADLERQLTDAGTERDELQARIGMLETKLSSARADGDRPSFPWSPILLVTLVFVLVGAVAILSRKRQRGIQVHDVPAMLDEREVFERPREGSFR